jgi:hypothetical protein
MEAPTANTAAAKAAIPAPKVFLRDALSVMGALSGTPEELVVRLGPAAPDSGRAALLEFSASGSRDCPLSDMTWVVDGRIAFASDAKAVTVPANYLMASLPDDPSAKIHVMGVSSADRAVTIRHAGGQSTIPLMFTKPKSVEDDGKVSVKRLPMALLMQILSRFPSRFSLASAIKDDSLVSDLFVDTSDDVIAGFATNSSAVFTSIVKREAEDQDSTISSQIDISLIEALRRLPKGHFPSKVTMTDHSIVLSNLPRWSITIRRKASSQVARAADIIAQVKKASSGVKTANTYSLEVGALEAALKKATTFASGATEVMLSGDGQTVVMASGPEARMRTRINLVAKAKKSGFSPITVHGPSLRQALTAFRDDSDVLVTVMPGGKALLLLSRMADHPKGFGNMAMLLAVQTGGK